MMAALCDDKIIEPLLYQGNCTAKLVEAWFERHLLPAILPGCVLILDNAPFHRKAVLEALAARKNCRIRWLPSYSPDLNDIEPWWAVVKNRAKKILQATACSLWQALTIAFQNVGNYQC